MRILIIDPNPESREVLATRVREALRQVGLKRTELAEGDLTLLNAPGEDGNSICAFLGPGCYDGAERCLQLFRSTFPTAPVALVLDNEIYAEDAVELRRILSVRIMAVADIAQMAAFILDSDQQLSAQPGSRNRGVISVAQLKGGVGATTIAAALAACWARHELSICLIDLDDINPQLTDWGRAGPSQRKVVADLLRQGEIPKYRVNELLHPIEGYDGRLVVVPQPERYQESFHFKADILEGAPTAAVFIESLLGALREEFDVIVCDCGRSWGIATFGILPMSQHVLLVSDDDGMSVRRTLDNLHRLARESDDEEEFDLSRWSVVLNAYTGKLLSPKDLSVEIQELDLFPESAVLYTVPFSERGRQWGGPGKSFYDMAEPAVRAGIEKMAFNLVPFRQDTDEAISGKFRRRLQKLVNPTPEG
ncbi:MAG: AAA family ATPase [Bdellovibrionales bacterium]|nr:AAA family ATPase [Bdellovibrionales bacterium]